MRGKIKDLDLDISYYTCLQLDQKLVFSYYSKAPLLRPPIDLRKNGLYIGVVLLVS